MNNLVEETTGFDQQGTARNRDMVRSHTVELDDVLLHYAEAGGPASEPPLVFLHGLSGSHAEFLHLAPQLAKQASVIFLDMRGHGLSAHVQDSYRVQDYARDVIAFLEEVVGVPVILLGHSLGGLVAAWIAAHHPQDLLGLVLVDPGFYILEMPFFAQSLFYSYFTDLYRHLRTYHAQGSSLESMIKYVGEAPVDGARTVLDVAGPDAVRDRAIQLHQLDPATLLPALAVADPALGETLLGDVRADGLLTLIRCPVHLMAAQYDLGGALRESDVQRAASKIAHSSHTIVQGAGHDIHLDQPEVFVKELIQFLDSIKQEVI